jgi:hypothetical protein
MGRINEKINVLNESLNLKDSFLIYLIKLKNKNNKNYDIILVKFNYYKKELDVK